MNFQKLIPYIIVLSIGIIIFQLTTTASTNIASVQTIPTHGPTVYPVTSAITLVPNQPAQTFQINHTSVTPIQTHFICDNRQCRLVMGAGSDTCNSDSDCYHMTCQNSSCIAVAGKGTNDCIHDTDCYHAVCKGLSCVDIPGKGIDACSVLSADMVGPDHTTAYGTVQYNPSCGHTVCQNMQCVVVQGAGVNGCDIDADCYHNACSNGQCIQVPGAGTDLCVDNANCQ